MSAKPPKTGASALALDTAARATPAGMAGGAVGEAGSKQALAQLAAAMAELKAVAIQPMLQRATDALRADDHVTGEKWAQQAVDRDPTSGFGWYLLGIAHERAGHWSGSIAAYEKALELLPDQAEVANDLGRLAFRLGMKPQAEKLFRHFLVRHPGHIEGVNNLVCAIRDQQRYEEAIEALRPTLQANPTSSMLWNTMGTVVAEQGDYVNAQIFFQEALRLEPDFPKARYNLGNAHLILGDAAAALEDCEAALKDITAESDRQMMRLSRSTILINLGRIGEGWDEYEARLDPQFSEVMHFLCDKQPWSPGYDLRGRNMLVFAEQGLGDEVLFANLLPDLLEALGPDGHLTLAVEPRLVSLFQRSFPTVEVGEHKTHMIQGYNVRHAQFLKDPDSIEVYAPLGSLLCEFRRTLDDFPSRKNFLTADPDRVAYWTKVLDEQAPQGPKIGLLWKSLSTRDARHRFFSPFEQWKPVLTAPGATFVNMQYGDCSAELELARRELGVKIWQPPGIDLKQDLDDIAALCCALDLTIGFSNATLNIGAACGAPAWLISTPGAWPRLGTARYPWYPQVRTFTPQKFGEWDPVMETVGEALAGFIAER